MMIHCVSCQMSYGYASHQSEPHCLYCGCKAAWWETSTHHVPTELQLIEKLQYQVSTLTEQKDAAEDAATYAEMGNVPDAMADIQKELNYKINLLGNDPVEVINELLESHGYQAVRAVA